MYSFDSAFYGHWFDLERERSRYTQLMRPCKFERAVPWFLKLRAVLARFSGHGNLIYNFLLSCNINVLRANVLKKFIVILKEGN